MTIEQVSALGIVTAAVVYLLALMAHSAEWASARGLAAGPGDATSQNRSASVEMWGRLGLNLTVIAAIAHATGVLARGVAADRAPWGNMYEFVTASLLFVVVTYLVLAFWKGARWLGLLTTLLLSVGNGLAATVLYVAVGPLVPALHSVWFVIHIVAACISAAGFNVGAAASILYLLKVRAEANGSTGGYLARIPGPRELDTFAYRAHAFAFPIWTFTIAAGSIWAEFAWGRYWGWDPKETWSLVTWVVYAAYLHARATAGWRGRSAAWIAIVGVATFWFNFIGINLLVSGLHSYAGI
ncbi:MAG TPA: c-type cytochrome biogenesis protein CcsB [Propionibacteriaceae bacterium]|nr:c-type cytochrome biogenesis protein CcsB [Propionibacteriaceae bacterium]